MTSIPIATALVAGLLHALEADHVAAVTAFVSRRPHPVRALGFGVRWAVGHSAALLLAGGAVVLLGIDVPSALIGALEVAVGFMLVGLGAWTLTTLSAEADEVRGTRDPRAARLAGGSTWVGAAHGVAGTAGFLAIIPAVLLASPWSAGGYLLLFGAGTVAAMGAYALVAGAVLHRAGALAPGLGRGLRVSAGVASIVVGGVWIYGAMG